MPPMARIRSLASSVLIHAVCAGVLVWMGLMMSDPELPTLSVATPRATPSVILERLADTPQPTFQPAARPTPQLEVEEVPVKIEHEPVDDLAAVLNSLPVDRPLHRPAPDFGRPIAFTSLRLSEPAPSEPVAEAIAETKPIEIHNPPPRYPRLARRRGLEGEVVVEVTILPDGTCADVKVVEHAGVGSFADAALDALRKWKFRPATRDGDPIAFIQRVRFIFRLKS